MFAGGKLAPRERAAAGATLGRLGDPRFLENTWFLPDEPLLGFVGIAEGSFRLGTSPEDIAALVARFPRQKAIFESEGPQHDDVRDACLQPQL